MNNEAQIKQQMLKMELRIIVLEKMVTAVVKETPLVQSPGASDQATFKAEAIYSLQKKYPGEEIPKSFD